MAKTGAKLLVEALTGEGVELIFGYPGGAVLPLYDTLYHEKILHVLVRHEQGAVHAAEGYTKVTGKPGVVVVTSGPGATNVITGIADAMSDSLPLVVFTGQVARQGIGKDAFQEADILGLTMPITKYNYQIRDVKDIPRVVKEAFHIANSGRKGPVVIDLPKDIAAEFSGEITATQLNLPSYQPTIEPNDLQVKKMMAALMTAQKPVVLVGAGVIHSQAQEELLEFIKAYDLPTLSTLLGLGAVPVSHPHFLGMGGMHGSYAANMALTECDLLINFGSRFDDRLASAPKEFAPQAQIVHVDIDPAEIGKVIETQIPIVADIKATLKAALAYPKKSLNHYEWVALNHQRKIRYPYTYDRENQTEIKPQKVIELVGELTNGEAIVVTDVGQHQMWAAQYYPFQDSRQLVTSGGLGTMGYGIPAAIGAKFGARNKEVVLFVGDGGFQMTNQELAILNEYQLNLKIIIINNHSLGMVRQWQESFYEGRHSQSVFNSQPDFVKLAGAYGIRGVKISEVANLEAELQQAFAHSGSVLIDIDVSATEHVLPMVPTGQPNHKMIGVE